MPNWVTNKGTITADKQTIDFIVDKITSGNSNFDFNNIIPEPTRKEDCDPKYYATEENHLQPSECKPWFNWYDWHYDYWGTKWNACDAWTYRPSDNVLMISFETAWCFPSPIWERLAQDYPTAIFNVDFADEDLGNNCGYFEAHNGKPHTEWVDTVEFACSVWGYSEDDLKEWGL